LFENRLFRDKVKVWMNTKKEIKSDSFLEWLNKLDNFKKFFEVVN